MYTSILNTNKNALRNLYNPSANLTKLSNTSMKSDFWNQQQRNVLCNVIKNTENKKIHIINGGPKSGKSTVLLGFIQNYLSRYKKKIPLSLQVNTFRRFKSSHEDKNIITKRYDFLYRFAYHDIGYIYNNVKNKRLKLIKIICSKRILRFYLEFSNIKFYFFYDTVNKKRSYSLNNFSLYQRNDILKKMLNDFIVKKKLLIDNEKKSIYIIKILEKIKKKMSSSRY